MAIPQSLWRTVRAWAVGNCGVYRVEVSTMVYQLRVCVSVCRFSPRNVCLSTEREFDDGRICTGTNRRTWFGDLHRWAGRYFLCLLSCGRRYELV